MNYMAHIIQQHGAQIYLKWKFMTVETMYNKYKSQKIHKGKPANYTGTTEQCWTGTVSVSKNVLHSNKGHVPRSIIKYSVAQTIVDAGKCLINLGGCWDAAVCWVVTLLQGAVSESSSGGMDVPPHSARCQEGKGPVKKVGGVIHSAVALQRQHLW